MVSDRSEDYTSFQGQRMEQCPNVDFLSLHTVRQGHYTSGRRGNDDSHWQ